MSQYDTLFSADEVERTKSEGRPFALPDLCRTSAFTDPAVSSTLFNFNFNAPPTLPSRPQNNHESLFHVPQELKLPTLRCLSTNLWPLVEDELHSDPTTAADEDENMFSSGEDEEDSDIWMDPETVVPPNDPRFFTWDSFLVQGANEPQNGYITEAGPGVLDAALEAGGETGVVVRTDVFCTCLLHMGLGRSSVLFLWDQKKGTFRLASDDGFRVSGCTSGIIGSIIKSFAECGTNIKRLERFANSVYGDFSISNPALVALAQCTTIITESIQKRLSTSNRPIRSILHLHSLIRDPALIADSFVQLTSAAVSPGDDCQLLSRLFDIVQQQQHRSGWLKPLLVETLARVSRPWLEFVEQWIGLDEGPGNLGVAELVREGGFVAVEESLELDKAGKERMAKNFIYKKKRVPTFMSAESVETVFETGRSLRYLEIFHPRHPLSIATPARSASAPRLRWKFSWQDLEDLQKQAQAYEKNLRAAIRKYTQQAESPGMDGVPEDPMVIDYHFETFGRSKEELSDTILESLEVMNRNLPSLEVSSEQDSLAAMVLHLTRSGSGPGSSQLTTFAPPLSITPILSFSHIFSAQSRLVNNACLRMFFKEHNVRDHLSLLRRFSLFGDGVFSSRLAHALFDANIDATERKPGAVRSGGTMGLKLGSRDTWPPASSELRLALMDVLTECFSQKTGIHTAGKQGELPGALSFAIRELSEEELEACTDPNSIAALDFLKLEYKPPSPLQVVITPLALYRYDRIFRLLLRVLRMVFVVNTFWRKSCSGSVDPTASKFAIEARHFVTTLANYMIESGIGTTWAGFERKLAEIERGIDREDGEESLDRLRAYHESILDRIMFATLSRKRQQPVMKIVDEIFVLVLRFAAGEGEMGALYRSFRRRTGIFISVCKGLSEKRGYGDGRKDLEGRRGTVDGVFGTGYKEEANLLGMLLLGLEMSGYYSKSTGKKW